jgi:hypothetical protein
MKNESKHNGCALFVGNDRKYVLELFFEK